MVHRGAVVWLQGRHGEWIWSEGSMPRVWHRLCRRAWQVGGWCTAGGPGIGSGHGRGSTLPIVATWHGVRPWGVGRYAEGACRGCGLQPRRCVAWGWWCMAVGGGAQGARRVQQHRGCIPPCGLMLQLAGAIHTPPAHSPCGTLWVCTRPSPARPCVMLSYTFTSHGPMYGGNPCPRTPHCALQPGTQSGLDCLSLCVCLLVRLQAAHAQLA